MVILGGLAVAAVLGGTMFYNPLRRKMDGIIGVGGSYVILTGIMLLITCIGELFGGSKVTTNATEVVTSIIIMVIALGYMIVVMVARCTTNAQRILLPFAACLIGAGFVVRLLAAIVLKIPMESGNSGKKAVFPARLKSPDGEYFTLQTDGGDNARYYGEKTGKSVTFYESDVRDGLPTGWDRA